MLRWVSVFAFELFKAFIIFVFGLFLVSILLSIPDIIKGFQIAEKYSRDGLLIILNSAGYEKLSFFIEGPKFVQNAYAQQHQKKIFREKDEDKVRFSFPVRLGISIFHVLYKSNQLKTWNSSQYRYRYFLNFYGPPLTPEILRSIPKNYWPEAVSSLVSNMANLENYSIVDFVQKVLPERSPELKKVFITHLTGEELVLKGFKGYFDLKFKPQFVEESVSAYNDFSEPQIANALNAGYQFYKIQSQEYAEIRGTEKEKTFVQTFETEIEKLCNSYVSIGTDLGLSKKLGDYIEAPFSRKLSGEY